MDNSNKQANQHQGEPEPQEQEEAKQSALQFLERLGISASLPQFSNKHYFLSELAANRLKVDSISRGRVTCSFPVTAPVSNYYRGLHGGVVATIAQRVATACARTIVPKEKPLFLGELRISYLSAASISAELIADGSVLKSGRNLTVVSIVIRHKDTKKLFYTAQATFYHLPAANL